MPRAAVYERHANCSQIDSAYTEVKKTAWKYIDDQCYQRFWTVTSGPGPGPGPNRTITKLAVGVVNTPETSTRVRFDVELPTCQMWEGCQRVAQRIHP